MKPFSGYHAKMRQGKNKNWSLGVVNARVKEGMNYKLRCWDL
jgi:hypothetical protein